MNDKPKNRLFYGDNLEILRRYLETESVDLVYLDPPFKSDRDYNILFEEKNGTKAAAQIQAFDDTWTWDAGSAAAYAELVERGDKVSDVMRAFHVFLGGSDMLAYLAMMALRLVELERVLKSTGSIYLHCDPTASHYLKLLMDAIFGPKQYLNEICWKRSSAHSDTKQGMRRCGRIRDVILLYSKGKKHVWNPVYTPYAEDYVGSEYRHRTPDGRNYKETDLTAAKPGGDVEYDWHVRRKLKAGSRWEADLTEEYLKPQKGYEYRVVRPYRRRFWAYSKQNMIGFAKSNLLIHRKTGMPRLMQFADEMEGVALQDLWDDIPPESGEKSLGYPTQKPEALLERIIETSSNEDDLVLDPFCGCGTTIAVANRLKRRWIGIDITHLAMNLLKNRLEETYGGQAMPDKEGKQVPLLSYETVGEPESLSGARNLAKENPYQFQWWILGRVGARPAEQKKGPDKGIDGRILFHEQVSAKKIETKEIVISVKAGKTGPTHVRDLVGVISREDAAIGVFICMAKPTKSMKAEVASAGFYHSKTWNRKHPRLQILTVEEILKGKVIDCPPLRWANATFRKAAKVRTKPPKQDLL